MAPRKKAKSTSKRKSKKPADRLFHPIKAKIEAARNKLRVEAKNEAKQNVKKSTVHHRYLKLKAAHKLLGFGPLDNILF